MGRRGGIVFERGRPLTVADGVYGEEAAFAVAVIIAGVLLVGGIAGMLVVLFYLKSFFFVMWSKGK